jgi:putative Mn2+ efflux pump MntP
MSGYLIWLAFFYSLDAMVIACVLGLESRVSGMVKGRELSILFSLMVIILFLTGWILGYVSSPVSGLFLGIAGSLVLLFLGVYYIGKARNEDKYYHKYNVVKMYKLMLWGLLAGISVFRYGLERGGELLSPGDGIMLLGFGVITYVATYFGVEIGERIWENNSYMSEVLGGLLLICLGIKVLLESLI